MLWNTVATSGIFLTPFLEKSMSCRIFAFVNNTKSFVIAFLVAFSLLLVAVFGRTHVLFLLTNYHYYPDTSICFC